MNSPSDDPDLLALKKLLKYLTNIDDVREKSVRIALQIVTGKLPDGIYLWPWVSVLFTYLFVVVFFLFCLCLGLMCLLC